VHGSNRLDVQRKESGEEREKKECVCVKVEREKKKKKRGTNDSSQKNGKHFCHRRFKKAIQKEKSHWGGRGEEEGVALIKMSISGRKEVSIGAEKPPNTTTILPPDFLREKSNNQQATRNPP